jgi:hypothetical protein
MQWETGHVFETPIQKFKKKSYEPGIPPGIDPLRIPGSSRYAIVRDIVARKSQLPHDFPASGYQ